MKRCIGLLAVVLALLLPATAVWAEESGDAGDITAQTLFSGWGYGDLSFLKDGNITSYASSDGDAQINLSNEAGISYLYLYFDLEYGEYTITDTDSGVTIVAGGSGILHEFVDLEAGFGYAPRNVALYFGRGSVRLSEIYCLSRGSLPDFVQTWSAPLEDGADILLFSTHSDDDQLFFAGLIPLYAGEKGCRVQVVLMTDHREGAFATNARIHEVLNGLWATGLTAYPVFGDFWDYRIDDIGGMYQYYANMGVTREDIQGFVVEQLRRFKPLVAIGHDLNGEYGHGMHKIYAENLARGIALAADASYFPESAQVYGTWQVQKTYLHLYGENQIVLDYDTPLERFGGLTAFQASQQLGFPCHHSQQWTWFKAWLVGSYGEITSTTQIAEYNPAYFGLYQTEVGQDVQKNDFLENIVTYAMQDVQAAGAVDALILDTPLEAARIAQARQAYEALTQSQKEKVSALDVLLALEAELAVMQSQQAADAAAAKAVTEKIDDLGPVSLESEAAILAAQAAYDALTQQQKALVTNRDALEAARESLAAMQQEAQAAANLQKQKRQLTVALCILLVLALLLVGLLLRNRQIQRRRRRRRRR